MLMEQSAQVPVNTDTASIVLMGGAGAVRAEIRALLVAELQSPAVQELESPRTIDRLPDERAVHLCIVCPLARRGALEDLERLRERLPDCPVLVVLDLQLEALAAVLTRHGFDDYIIRTPSYGPRLQAAVAELLEPTSSRRRRLHALQDHARQFRELVECAAQGMLIQVRGRPVYVNAALVRLLGYEHPDELLRLDSMLEVVDPRDQPRMRGLMARREDSRNAPQVYECRARRRDGSLVWLEGRVNPVTWAGQAAQQHTLVDVSDRHRAVNALRLAVRIAGKASLEGSMTDALEVTLKRLARGMGWDLAESWLPSAREDMLRPGPAWSRDKQRFRRFLDASAKLELRAGESLPGRVIASGRPQWVAEIAGNDSGDCRRSIVANDAGLASGCGIPVRAHGRTAAVLCFFSREACPEQPAVMAALAAAASGLGPILLHIQSEQARRAGLALTEKIIARNADGILVVDEEDHIRFANPAAERAFGRSQKSLQGMPFGTPSVSGELAEIEIHNVREGRARVNELRFVEIEWQGRPARLVSLRDITERHEAREALERSRRALQERVKELNCLYTVSELLTRSDLDWESVLQGVVAAIPAAMQSPQAAGARLRVEEVDAATPSFRATRWRITTELRLGEERLGCLEVCYLDSQPEADRGPFLNEEYELCGEVARRVAQTLSTRRYQQELDFSRRRFQDFAEAASDWLWEMDEHLRFTYFSDRIETVMGLPAEHWLGKRRIDLSAETPQDPKWAQHEADLRARRPFRQFRYALAMPDGSVKHIAISGVPVYDHNGQFKGYRGSGSDETEEVRARDQAIESERRLRTVADHLPGIVFQRLRRTDGTISYPYVSAGTLNALGYTAGALQADPRLWMERIHQEDRPRFDLIMAHSARALEPMDLNYRARTRDGEERWFWHRSSPRRLDNDEVVWDCIDLDITERKKAEARIQYLGYHDQLTGLANRERFLERLSQVLPIAERSASPVAVAMLGLNRFKQVNEELGISGGDEVLRTAAQRFQSGLRPEDTLARFGGDRFLVLLPSVSADPATHEPLERLITAMEGPFTVKGRQILLSFTMGVAVFPDDGDAPETLIQKADSAQAHYKRWGPGHGYTLYQPQMPDSTTSRLALEKGLRDAIDKEGELEGYFQPLFDAASGRLTAVETLARWNHPERGMLSPAEFIPLAEDTGLIGRLGMKLLRQACGRVRQWDRAGLPPVILAVNLSASQLRDPDLCSTVLDILEETGVPAGRLVLEVTESSLITDLANASQVMEELGAFGVHFALDDFGVGYSSLSYLGSLPVQALKIDRSFLRGLRSGSPNETTIKAISALAHALDLHVVAEGIETPEQLEHVKTLGCDTLQGFYLARPMPGHELEMLLGGGVAAGG